jgi:hypothetical protein
MRLNRLIALSFFVLGTSGLDARTTLPELATKQSITNIRFLSKDGSVTIYQQRSGSLFYSTNYKVTEITKGELGSNYDVFSTPERKRLLFTRDSHYHDFISLRRNREIFQLNFGETTPSAVGEGLNPRLHLKDSWSSFYNAYTKTLHLKALTNVLNFEIKLSSGKNPYFTPEVVMPNENDVLYTDLNNDGYPGILIFRKNTKKFELLQKFPEAARKIEICLQGNELIVGEFGLDPTSSKSSIWSVPINPLDFNQRTTYYESEQNDIGNLICTISNEHIYFVKNIGQEKGRETFEAAKLTKKTKKTEIISDVTYATQIVDIDGNLLLPHQGKFYVLLGEHNMTQFDLLKQKLEDAQ